MSSAAKGNEAQDTVIDTASGEQTVGNAVLPHSMTEEFVAESRTPQAEELLPEKMKDVEVVEHNGGQQQLVSRTESSTDARGEVKGLPFGKKWSAGKGAREDAKSEREIGLARDEQELEASKSGPQVSRVSPEVRTESDRVTTEEEQENDLEEMQTAAETTESDEELNSSAQTWVCVTGASGFIGSHIVQQLLELGFCVRCTVVRCSSLSSCP